MSKPTEGGGPGQSTAPTQRRECLSAPQVIIAARQRELRPVNGQETAFISSLHHAAVIYADQSRFEVIPLIPRSKAPILKNGVKGCSSNATLLRSWWSQWPCANVGIATGVPSKIVVLDFDQPGAMEALRAFEGEFGALPETPRVLTGKGGFHLYFTSDDSFKNYVRFRPNVDVRSDGGFVVAPPSVHENGRRYEWDPALHIRKIPIAPLPARVAAGLREVKGQSASGSPRSGRPAEYWQKLSVEGVAEGQRNQRLAEFCGHLFRKNIDALVARELLHAWNERRCRPPLHGLEVDRILNSIARAEIQRHVQGGRHGRI